VDFGSDLLRGGAGVDTSFRVRDGEDCFLERTLRDLLAHGSRAAALVGDLETDNDARRLAASGRCEQINTHGICHLEAEMVSKHLEGWDLAGLDYLFIENVGNLVCPSSYDLGEAVRVALLSVTERGRQAVEVSHVVQFADAAVITKSILRDRVNSTVKRL